MKTRAAILVELNQPLVVDEIDLPDALAVGQVLVRVQTSGICGSQLGEIDGVKGPDRYLPHLLGHEGFAVVLDVGANVTRVKAGDHVVMHWRKGAGIDAAPPRYRWGAKALNAGYVTTFNDHAVVSENRLTRVPPSTSPDLAALLGCALTTGFGVVSYDAALHIGESLVVFGAGSIGQSVVIGARLAGAHPIVAVDTVQRKLELARRFGATHALDGAGDVASALHSIFGADGADVAVETTGRSQVIENAYAATSNQGGRTVLVGVPRADDPARLPTLRLHLGQRLIGSHGGNAEPARDIPRLLALSSTGAFDALPMVDRRCRLEDINAAIGDLRAGLATKCMIDLGAPGPAP